MSFSLPFIFFEVFPRHKSFIFISAKDTMGVAFATFFKILQPFIKTPESGAQTSIFCAVDESVANQSGLYYADCKVGNKGRSQVDPGNAICFVNVRNCFHI